MTASSEGGSFFLLGGARSGKSAAAQNLALRLAEQGELEVSAVVTAEPIDDEMADRIERHRQQRPASWSTIEAPHDVVESVAAVDPSDVVLIDCLTVWLFNLLFSGADPAAVEAQGLQLAELCRDRSGPSIVVSNEVGLGLVPADPESRSFRDVQGRVNQAMVSNLKKSFFVVAGGLLPLQVP